MKSKSIYRTAFLSQRVFNPIWISNMPAFALSAFVAAISSRHAYASPAEFPEGMNIANGISFFPWQSYSQYQSGYSNLGMEVSNGGAYLLSGVPESAPWAMDGGLLLAGQPIQFYLGAIYSSTEWGEGRFEIFRGGDYGVTGSSPIFGIDSAANSASFDSLAVSITNGSLSIGGSPALTTSSAQPILASQGFLQTSSLISALDELSSAPASEVWTSAFVPRGNVDPLPGWTEGGSLALGTSTASGEKAIAFGASSTASARSATAIGTLATASSDFSTAIGQNVTASGQWSIAIGNGVTASGHYSLASGLNNTASGQYSAASGFNSSASGVASTARGNSAVSTGYASTAFGWGASAKARCEMAVGNYNLESSPSTPLSINGLNGLFRVGNGTSTIRSDALTVLWSGETTLANKEWTIATNASPGDSSTALADPPSPTDSGGNALVVDGHAVLNGKVVISVPQGDISMGIYGN